MYISNFFVFIPMKKKESVCKRTFTTYAVFRFVFFFFYLLFFLYNYLFSD